MSSLELDHYIEQGITVVVATGDINSATAQEFGSYLKDAINQAENGNVILDMSHVYYMSSAGLRDIVSGLKIARRNGGDLHLAVGAGQRALSAGFDRHPSEAPVGCQAPAPSDVAGDSLGHSL